MSYKNLSSHSSFFGIKLWIILTAFILLFTLLLLMAIFIIFIYLRRHKKSISLKPRFLVPNAISCTTNFRNSYSSSSLDKSLLSQNILGVELNRCDNFGGISNNVADFESAARYSHLVSDPWRGNRFGYKDVEMLTNGFSDENLIGHGDRGFMYRGILLDATRVAVKSLLLSKSCRDEEFVAEVEVIGQVRHKNLVKLLGYCIEGDYRMLVNEYIDNGNLHQWLHGWKEQVSPLTWGIRMDIILGVAKGLAYLHEDIEPKIVHQNLKSTNILLDHQWNPKISDFGIVKLCGPEENHLAARRMGTSGYLSQENASSGVLNERTDVYSFGILIMEIICGRTPVDRNQPQVYLIEWLKSMVASHKIMHVPDPKLPEMPSSKEFKRILLLALRCVDPNMKHRPTMGDVIHMLEPRDLLLNDEHWMSRDSSSHQRRSKESQAIAKSVEGDLKTHDKDSSSNVYQKMLSK